MKIDINNLMPNKQYQLYISKNIYINLSNAYTLRHLLYTSEKQEEEERLCNYHTNSTIPFVFTILFILCIHVTTCIELLH